MGLLAIAMRRHSIPIAELDMLIDGVAMDLTTTRYQTWDELRAYANLVASVTIMKKGTGTASPAEVLAAAAE